MRGAAGTVGPGHTPAAPGGWENKLGEGAKGFFVSGPSPYKKLPQTPTPNPIRKNWSLRRPACA
jgi:hypothetical protein